MEVNQKNWSCPKKQKARVDTIISQWSSNFLSNAIPKDMQYWTLPGQCATAEGEPRAGCEVDQIIDSGLITPSQFHGVEVNTEINDLNVKAYPHLNWYNEDLYKAMIIALNEGNLRPAIVNIDFPQTPDGAGEYASKMLAMLTDLPMDMLVVVNYVLRMRHYKTKKGRYAIDKLNKWEQFKYAARSNKWKMSDEFYGYSGTESRSRTCMGTYIFIKKAEV